jgi:hypothetical protein
VFFIEKRKGKIQERMCKSERGNKEHKIKSLMHKAIPVGH